MEQEGQNEFFNSDYTHHTGNNTPQDFKSWARS